VPPPVIAANRAQLMSLVATNFLGQNTPAIAATEAHYGEMWAQDATVMYAYAAATAAASRLAPFTAPPHSSNPVGLAGQAVPVTAAGATSAATNAQTLLTSAMPGALQGLASPAQAVPILTIPGAAEASAGLGAADIALAGGAWQSASLDSSEILSVGDALSANQGEILNAIGQLRPTGALASAGSAGPVAGGAPAPVSGGMGRAVSVGGLAVPSSWAAAAPEIRAVAYALPATSVGAAPAVLAGTSGTAFNEMALAGMAGGALAGTRPGRRELVGATARERVTPQRSPANPVVGIAAELREFAALRDAGILTDEEFNELKRRLLNC
jgi:PPE-repeat protein